jgi:hypothetical protein
MKIKKLMIPFARIWYLRIRSSLWCGPAASCIGRSIQHQSLECYLTMNRWSKNRLIKALGIQIFLGLAICVFAWGLEYKLSLYDPPQTASHQIPKAKLLSRDELSSTAENPLVVRTKTTTSVIYTVSTVVFLILLLAPSVLNAPASGQREQCASRPWHLRRVTLRTSFVRPPPVLV